MYADEIDAEQRKHVIDAASGLFYSRGVQQVGMHEIRAAAGVSLKRLYALFGSKDELVLGYLDRVGAPWRRRLARHVEAAEPSERIGALFDYLRLWFAEQDFRGCAYTNSFGELGASLEQAAVAAREHKRLVREMIGRWVADLGGDDCLADQIALLVEGAITTAAISGDVDQVAVRAKSAAETLVRTSVTPL